LKTSIGIGMADMLCCLMVDNGRSVEVKIAWSTGRVSECIMFECHQGRVMAGKGLAEILDSRRRHE